MKKKRNDRKYSRFFSCLLVAIMLFTTVAPIGSFAGANVFEFSGTAWSTTPQVWRDGDRLPEDGSTYSFSDVMDYSVVAFASNDGVDTAGVAMLGTDMAMYGTALSRTPSNCLVVKTSDGAEFSIAQLTLANADGAAHSTSISGYLNNNLVVSKVVTVTDAATTTFSDVDLLDDAKFRYIDEIRITSSNLDMIGLKRVVFAAATPPLLAPKVLTADTTNNSVDNEMEIKFPSDPAFNAAITAVKYDGNILNVSQYTISDGMIMLKPHINSNNYLQIPKTADLTIVATGYTDSTVSQEIKAGIAFSLEVTQQPVLGAASGNTFTTQPIVKLKDQYSNHCTTGISSAATVTATKVAGTGDFNLTGTTGLQATAGTVTFTNLAATTVNAGTAKLKFITSTYFPQMGNTIASEVQSADVEVPSIAPAATPAHTVTATIDSGNKTAGVAFPVTLTVKKSDGTTDTSFNGTKAVTISGISDAPTAGAGRFNNVNLISDEGSVTQIVNVDFVNGVAQPALELNLAATIRVNFRVGTVSTPTTSINNVTVVPSTAATLIHTNIPSAPAANGGQFASQPALYIRDAYGNTRFTDNLTVVTVGKAALNNGSWTLTGTASATAVNGIARFNNLGANNTLATPLQVKLTYYINGNPVLDSGPVTLPAAPVTGAHSVVATLADNPLIAGAETTLTLTVKKSDGTTDTSITEGIGISISGVSAAPNGSYGSISGDPLTSASVTGQPVSAWFNNGVFITPIRLNKAGTHNLTFSVPGVTNYSASTGDITVSPSNPTGLKVMQHAVSPLTNGGLLATQPVVALVDLYSNVCTNDSISAVIADNAGDINWTLGGTKTKPLVNGIATFTDLTATSANNLNTSVRYSWSIAPFTKSSPISIPTPAPTVIPAYTVEASTNTSMIAGDATTVTLNVKKSDGTTDTSFNGTKQVTISNVAVAPNTSYGYLNGEELTAASQVGQNVAVNFTNGVATVPLKLTKAGAQALKFTVAGVTTSETNNLNVIVAPNSASRLVLHQNITAPATPNGSFAQQPIVHILDMYDNLCTNDSTFQVTASKQDTGTWTLTGTKTATAVSGVATFSNLGVQNTGAIAGAKLSFDGPTMLGLVPVQSAAVNLTATPSVTPPSGSSSGSGSGGGGGASTTPVTSNTPPTQTRPIDVIVNGINKPSGTLITGQTSGGQQLATVAVSSSGVTEQLKTPATDGKPSVIIDVPKVNVSNATTTYSAEVPAQSTAAMSGVDATLSVRTPISTVELTPTAVDKLAELISRYAVGDASLRVSASQASASTRPASVGSQSLVSVLNTPVEFSTAVVSGNSKVNVSDYSVFVARNFEYHPSVYEESLRQAKLAGLTGTGNAALGTQGVVYHGGEAYPVPTYRGPSGAKINSITNSVYDLIFYSKSFLDTKGHKYDAAVTNMASRLIVAGESETKFNPDAKVTRAEFATMVTRALGLYRGELGNSKFSDLTRIGGLNVGITVAADRSLVKGVGNGHFAPYKNITAQDMSQIIYNIVKTYGEPSTFASKAPAVETTGWAKEAVAFTTKTGILETKSADKEMTRAEAAYAIEQMLEGMKLIDKRK